MSLADIYIKKTCALIRNASFQDIFVCLQLLEFGTFVAEDVRTKLTLLESTIVTVSKSVIQHRLVS